MSTLATKQTEVKYAKRGKRGMLPYPTGEYDENATYVATENVAPYVIFDKLYYVMNKVGSWHGATRESDPKRDYAAYGQNATWILFEEYKAMYVELLMARMGLIGKSVFYDQYTFSQKGTDANGTPSDNYQGFEDGSFIPNILIDWVEGSMTLLKLVAKGAKIEGRLTAEEKSKIAGMTVTRAALRYDDAVRNPDTDEIITPYVRRVALGQEARPTSSGTSTFFSIEHKASSVRKKLIWIDSAETTDEPMAALEDHRSFNRAIDIVRGTLRISPGNLVDIPGVVMAGRVNASGTVEYAYGRKRLYNNEGVLVPFTVKKNSSSWIDYTVRHELGHTNYTVMAIPYSPGYEWRKYHAHVDVFNSNEFSILFLDSSIANKTVESGFFFTVMGENIPD